MVYQQIVGNAAIWGVAAGAFQTIIDLNTSASMATVLTKGFAYCHSSLANCKIKVFRDDGTNYNFVGEVLFNTSSGTNTIPMNISIQSGDLIGYYCPNTLGVAYDTSAGTSVYQSGDITTNTLKTSWSNLTGTHRLNAGYDDAEHYVKVGGNDALNGFSWTNAWATINKAATTVADGSTVHIGFGDYVLEPATNKIAPQNIGATGIFYLPETATTGGGTGTVSIEQNP